MHKTHTSEQKEKRQQGNFKLLFFTKRFYTHKKHKTHISEQKEKRQRFYALKNYLWGRNLVFRLYALCAFCAFCAFCACKICMHACIFFGKKIKEV